MKDIKLQERDLTNFQEKKKKKDVGEENYKI